MSGKPQGLFSLLLLVGALALLLLGDGCNDKTEGLEGTAENPHSQDSAARTTDRLAKAQQKALEPIARNRLTKATLTAAHEWYQLDTENAMPAYLLAYLVLREDGSDNAATGAAEGEQANARATELVREGNRRPYCFAREPAPDQQILRIPGLLRGLARQWKRHYEATDSAADKTRSAVDMVEAAVTIASTEHPADEDVDEVLQSLFFLTGSAMAQLIAGDFLEASQDAEAELPVAFQRFDSRREEACTEYARILRSLRDSADTSERPVPREHEALREAVRQLNHALDQLRQEVTANVQDE